MFILLILLIISKLLQKKLNFYHIYFHDQNNQMFELSNHQRIFFGLDPVLDSWDKVAFKGDNYRPDSILYFEGNTIKKHVISIEKEYNERQYDIQTEKRELVLPKTKKGKPKKLTPSVFESKTPIGVYLNMTTSDGLTIGNYTSQRTFYASRWERKKAKSGLKKLIQEFIEDSPRDHFSKIEEFKNTKRKNIKFKAGDFFTFKLNRSEYGFGRILFDVHKARSKKLLPSNHGFLMRMGKPVLIKFYAFNSKTKEVDLEVLKSQKSLPSDYMMDNLIFYGDYEIVGNKQLEYDELDFPLSYGRRIDGTPNTYLHWGLIHLELPVKDFSQYLAVDDEKLSNSIDFVNSNNPYSNLWIGFYPSFDGIDILNTIRNNGNYDFEKSTSNMNKWDLRNPKHDAIRIDILKRFGLNPAKNYIENCKLTGTKDILDLIEEMK